MAILAIAVFAKFTVGEAITVELQAHRFGAIARLLYADPALSSQKIIKMSIVQLVSRK